SMPGSTRRRCRRGSSSLPPRRGPERRKSSQPSLPARSQNGRRWPDSRASPANEQPNGLAPRAKQDFERKASLGAESKTWSGKQDLERNDDSNRNHSALSRSIPRLARRNRRCSRQRERDRDGGEGAEQHDHVTARRQQVARPDVEGVVPDP